MSPDVLMKVIEQMILLGIVGAIGLGVKQLQAICHELTLLKINLAVIVEQVKDHDRRLIKVEAKVQGP